MEKVVSMIGVAVLLLFLSACVTSVEPVNGGGVEKGTLTTKGQNEQYEQYESDEMITCPVQYIRTDGWEENEVYPQITVIDRAFALDAYIENKRLSYHLGYREHVSSDTTIGFATAVEKYNDAWFEQHNLVLVLLEEGSGSICHKVQGITSKGEICIERIIPEVGTCDMAHWHILLELPKDSPVLEQELTVEFLYEEDWVPPPVVASYASRYANVQVTLPGEGWEWEEIPDTGGDEPFGIRFWPEGDKAAAVEVCCHPQIIGLCGTGLDTEKLVLDNGMEVFVHAYDEKPWFLVTFEKTSGYYYAERNTDSRAYDEEIMEILSSAVLGEGAAAYDKIVAIAAQESGADYEYATARFDINTGFWTVYLGKINTAGGDVEVVINDIGGIESIAYNE